MVTSLTVSRVVLQWYSTLLSLPALGSLSSVLWSRQDDVEDDHNHKHDHQ